MSQRKISDEQLIAEYNNGLTYKQIAEKYGMSKRNVERLGAKLAKRGLLSTRRAPGFGVNGESLLVDKNGNVIMRWIKTARDREEMEQLMEAARDAFTDEIPRAEAVPVPEIDFQKAWHFIRCLICISGRLLIKLNAVRATILGSLSAC